MGISYSDKMERQEDIDILIYIHYDSLIAMTCQDDNAILLTMRYQGIREWNTRE